ncbi:hypothetical protein [Streptomyces sp. NPDC056194]|uniref:hypothetical protein n=1 Tax=Streptomyces sp. NPDC056194 TaxID=3345744 RepID=UPI0035E38876
MSNTFARPRAQRLFGAVAWFTVWVAAIGTVVLVLTGVPDVWWPETGQAFAASYPTPTQPAPSPVEDSEVCAPILGPAHDYCLRGVTQAAQRGPGGHGGGTPERALLLVPVALGLTLILRLRRSPR